MEIEYWMVIADDDDADAVDDDDDYAIDVSTLPIYASFSGGSSSGGSDSGAY